jgi:cytochrome c oxidase cbb3-type subunit III
MQRRALYRCLLFVSLAALSGCGRLPGKPKEADRWKPPEANMDFADLYQTNCLACHSNGRTLGASISMNNPPYLAVIPKETLRKVVADGIPQTSMPGYSSKAGGLLTDDQINVLVEGIYNWAKGREVPTDNLPPYSAALGEAERGEAVFAQDCANCHGSEGAGVPGKAGSVVDPTYLSLVSNQYLRTVVIAGRPELGMPGFRDYVPGKPMSAEEISDVVAWLSSRREATASGEQPTQATEATAGAQPSPTSQQ